MANIMVVDDEPQTRVQLNSVLADELGHELVFAGDGEAAIATYERAQPDLVITDLVMPRLNGILMIEHLKTLYPDSRIIAISGKAPEQLRRAEAEGAMASLMKPIAKDELVAVVDRALAGPRPWDRAK